MNIGYIHMGHLTQKYLWAFADSEGQDHPEHLQNCCIGLPGSAS